MVDQLLKTTLFVTILLGASIGLAQPTEERRRGFNAEAQWDRDHRQSPASAQKDQGPRRPGREWGSAAPVLGEQARDFGIIFEHAHVISRSEKDLEWLRTTTNNLADDKIAEVIRLREQALTIEKELFVKQVHNRADKILGRIREAKVNDTALSDNQILNRVETKVAALREEGTSYEAIRKILDDFRPEERRRGPSEKSADGGPTERAERLRRELGVLTKRQESIRGELRGMGVFDGASQIAEAPDEARPRRER